MDTTSQRLFELARLFLKLGLTAFGGPAAHIAMMHEEVVTRRKWLSDQEFLDLLGATNLIPGPNSTEMAIHIGFVRAGWRGLLIAGVCFILPAMFMVTGLAWAYVAYGTLPQVEWLLYGIKPVIIAVILQALWALGQKALSSVLTAGTAVVVFAAYFAGINEIVLLIAGGVLLLIVAALRMRANGSSALLPAPFSTWLGPAAAAAIVANVPFSFPLLFLTFLKIGSVLYGSGYVLLAFLRADFVERLGWLTDSQLLDAIIVGQITPGPVFTTATFIGYLLGGVPGAILATVGIFLPAFVFVAVSNHLIPRLRRSSWVAAALDGVTAASLGLMAAVTVQLARPSLTDSLTILIFAAAAIALFRYKLNTTWLIAAGGILGVIRHLVIG